MYQWRGAPAGLADWIRREVVLEGELSEGAQGSSVRRVQEWLTLNRHAVAIDGTYGAITTDVVSRFQQAEALPSTGRVDAATFARLVAPMREALRPRGEEAGLNAALLAQAHAHLAQGPREVGGQNRGPWVRLYTDGHDGSAWAWCAGFVTFVLRQACELLRRDPPIRGSVSCDTLAAQAKAAGSFVSEAEAKQRGVPAGSLFLVRRTESDWTHTGIVESAGPLLFRTIEGNSNDAGEREGYEVCSVSRGYAGKDFLLR